MGKPEHGTAADGHTSKNFVPGSSSSRERKKGIPWTKEEHLLFLSGLKTHGKGNWRGISRNFVMSRTPTQVASHAQKYFVRLARMRRRSSDEISPPPIAENAPKVVEVSTVGVLPREESVTATIVKSEDITKYDSVTATIVKSEDITKYDSVRNDSTTLVEIDEEIANVHSEMSTLTTKLETLAAKLEILKGKRAQYVESAMPSLSNGSDQ